MTNIYDLLRKIKAQADKAVPGAAPLSDGKGLYIILSKEDQQFLEHYLTTPEHMIFFKGYKTGKLVPIEVEDPAVAQRYIDNGYEIDGKPAEPEVSYDLSLAGWPDDIFVLLSEAMMQCPNFANIVIGAAKFYKEHAPGCPICQQNHAGKFPNDCPDLHDFRGWEFYKRQNQQNAEGRQADTQRKAAGDIGANQTDTGGQ